MGSIVVNYPDISDADLVFDEQETKEILSFFWPERAEQIRGTAVTTDTRRFAQTLLVAAVDASYAMAFIHGLAEVLVMRKPGKGVGNLVRKLARRYVRHWWRHATEDDLPDAKIYEAVRAAIAQKNKEGMVERLSGIARRQRKPAPFYVAACHPIAWA